MKKTILVPLFAGLLLAGCNRTRTDSNKFSANDQPPASKPTADEQAATARQDATRQAQATAASETPKIDTSRIDTSAQTPASTPIAATPAKSTDSTASATQTVPATPAATDSYTVAANPPAIAPVAAAKTDSESKPDISARLTEWKLTADEIKSEFEKDGRIERSRTARADEPTGPMDSILVASINRRLQADSETSAMKLDLTADKGVVTLDGSAQSLDQMGRAIAIALDTDGVTKAISTMKLVQPE